MRTIDGGNGGPGDAGGQRTADGGRAARAGVPTIPLPRDSAAAAAATGAALRTAAQAVPAQASTGVAELLRGPVREARVLLSVPAAVYLTVQTPQGSDVVGVLTADAARLPLGCVLFRPSNGGTPGPSCPPPGRRCCPRASGCSAPRSTARASRTAPSPCPGCPAVPAARWPPCAERSAGPTSTPRCAPRPG
jgi:hypothetical protein